MNEILRTYVAGLNHARYREVAIAVGIPCELTWEIENLYDGNAIRIDIGGIKVGYIPKLKTALLHPYVKRQIKLHCEVLIFDESKSEFDKLVVSVSAERPMSEIKELAL